MNADHGTDFADGQRENVSTNVLVTHTKQPTDHIDAQETPTTSHVDTSAGGQQIQRDPSVVLAAIAQVRKEAPKITDINRSVDAVEVVKETQTHKKTFLFTLLWIMFHL